MVRFVGAPLIALTSLALAGAGVAAAIPASAAGDDILLTWKVTDSWSGGATVDATVTNKSTTAVSPWAVSVTGGPTVASVWNATMSPANTFNAPTWAPGLPAGGSATFGLSVSASSAPTGCTVAGHTCRVVAVAPSPTPTPTSSPTTSPTGTPTPTTSPVPGPSNLPTPVKYTPTSTASGTINYHLNLPYGSGNVEKLNLSSNYTDLIISNYVSGALLGRLINEKDPQLKFDKDYVYGSNFAQLLQENINTAGYTNTTDWINATATERASLLAAGQGGPYQINDYSKRLENENGIGLINFTALQKGLGYTVEAQDNGSQTASKGPDSLDQKYFGPMAAAYFHLNDYNRMAMNNAESWGPQYANYGKCLTNLRKPEAASAPYNNLDMILNAAYNAGTYSTILSDYYRICAGQFGTGVEAAQVKSMGDYSITDTDYQKAIGTKEAAGSTFILYPRQVRIYLDQMYNKATYPSAAITGTTSIKLTASDIGAVFGNSMGTLAYVDGTGAYKYIPQADSAAAYSAALSSNGLTTSSTLDISKTADRAKFFALLDSSIANLATRLNTNFGAVTQTTLGGTSPTPTPTPTSPSPTGTPTPTPTPTTATPTPTPTPTTAGALSVKLTAASDWGTGRTMDAVITNKGTSPTSAWTVTFGWPRDIAPWNAVRQSYTSGKVTVGNTAWNGAIPAGGTTNFGFTDSSSTLPKPTSCTATVNGKSVPCTIVP